MAQLEEIRANSEQIAELFLKEFGFASHQIESYNEFVIHKLPRIITSSWLEYVYGTKTYKAQFENVNCKKPYVNNNGIVKNLKPQECRERDLNYQTEVFMDIKITDEEGVVTTQNVFLGAIPVMVKSCLCRLEGLNEEQLIKKRECPLDPGGYFIINGNEKVIINQDRMNHNEVFVFKCKDLPEEKTDRNKLIKFLYSAEVRSHADGCEPNITTTYVKLSAKKGTHPPKIYCEIPYLSDLVPIHVLTTAMGITDYKKYYQNPLIDKILEHSFLETVSLDDSWLYLAGLVMVTGVSTHQEKLEYARKCVFEKLFQNVTHPEKKKYYLFNMCEQLLLTALGKRPLDDRDACGKKRVESTGGLITNLFKSLWKQLLKNTKKILEKKKNTSVHKELTQKITLPLRKAFATGNWTCVKTISAIKAGISQILNRHNFISTISHLRRLKTPSDKNSKIVKPRHLHSSQFYLLCPAETPEGQTCGLEKSYAILTRLTIGFPEELILDYLSLLGCKSLDEPSDVHIYLNGTVVGWTSQPSEMIRKLRQFRREGKIHYEVSISQNKDGVRIYTDEGRMISPFYILPYTPLRALEKVDTFHQLLQRKVIEFLDPFETETLYISETPWQTLPDHTHAIIDPAFLLGISASTAPFPDHNQSPRNIYQSAMGKQALGVFAYNFLHRYDTNAHILCYPQKPLMNTMTMRLAKSDQLPSGQNLIVAIATYTGYNQEDSVIINRGAIDRGLLRSMCFYSYTEGDKKKHGVIEEICNPLEKGLKESRLNGYSRLEKDGLPAERTPYSKKDLLIGKTVQTDVLRDVSVNVKVNGMDENSITETSEGYAVTVTGHCVVERVLITQNMESNRTVKIKTRQTRIPQIGDKVASRSAQKGIIGMILPPEDMPFAEDGIIPDLIMNPNAIPSRMTIAQVLESFTNGYLCHEGLFGDCTPFGTYDYRTISTQLEKLGFDPHGEKKLISGITGEEMECSIFVGPTYYQRLKHMVDDKIHARSQNGPREALTHQPISGRKVGGGFKMGEMEVWAAGSHGASNFIIDRMVNNSDKYEWYLCDYCGLSAVADTKNNIFECRRCNQNTAISKVKIPYAYKLLAQELMAMGIGVWTHV